MAQMVFFPHAGGFAAGYMHLASMVEELSCKKVSTYIIEYAGRGKKSKDEGYKGLIDAVQKITQELVTGFLNGEPLVFFGHSMGAYIALETAYALRSMYDIVPCVMFLSGQSSPYHISNREHEMSDEEGFAYLKRLGGVSDEVVQNKLFYEKLYQYVREDVKMLDEYDAPERNLKLNSDLYIMNGKQDPELKQDKLVLWSEITSKNCEIKMFSGNHFYMNDYTEEVVDYIYDKIRKAINK